MIIRHGEKPGDPASDSSGGPDLSIVGSARAAALPSLFTPNPATTPVGSEPQTTCGLAQSANGEYAGTYGSATAPTGPPLFPVPNFLFATQQTASGGSNRPYETIVPLSEALPGAPVFINNGYPNGNYADVATEILTTNPAKYAGQVVLICWHHGNIPALAEQFQVPAKEIKKLNFTKWPPTVFDVIFLITWPGGQATLNLGYQQLLYGDTSAPTK
jgi:hypothetical protein